ncbi:Fic family protein [Aphanothece sacrum]|uniref:Death-on-curing protein n=1 Tax=Aphanothece sacrum FPU1 TaxID=1920663 RepID=A0A401ICH2_APHSA|nr:Fic family protein [Aphanothece sacrum]GBF78926.1 death-on-curing protein [Aphanothece sacrum FPU1]GBF86727.1 death-on-curing protein [Aphanothece sacrum FPU3]
MTSYYQWLTQLEVVTLHNAIIRDYGGHSNILDEGALESTLHRPQNLVYYQPDSTVFDLAAAYGYGIVININHFFDYFFSSITIKILI